VLDALENRGVPLTFDALAELFAVKGEQASNAFRRRLKRMASGGQLLVNRKGEYCLLEKIGALTGIVSAHSDGYGFLTPDDGSDDVYLSYQEMRQLLSGDRIAVHVAGAGRAGKRAGTVVEILERGKATAVGRYQREHGVGYVIESGRSPHQFLIADHHRGAAQPGQVVKLEIIEYPGRYREAQGKVVRVLGDLADPGLATEVAIEQFGLRSGWPPPVRQAAESWGNRVRPTDKQGREDLRQVPLVTIDGADARDFDDAVYAQPRDTGGWRLIVAIADVSHYVRPGDALDSEAKQRGTSVYFPDRVLPMLPENLSNGLCSLKPRVDRLCLACEMQIDLDGKVTRSRFHKGVMRSAARLTYQEVDELRRQGKSGKRLGLLREQLANLYDVYQALAKARRQRGALDLDLPEVKIELGADGGIRKIAPHLRTDAHRLIEECMIAANVQAAKFLRRHRLATLFRVHDGPQEEKFEELRLLLQELGIKVAAQAQTDPRQLNRVLQAIASRPDHQLLAMAVLRSMSQAVYQPANTGHFGLALDAYAHFTSPIRRYPDLLVHRGIAHVLAGAKPGSFGYDTPAMEEAGQRCSGQERLADDATRHVEARYKCAYMLQHVGDVFEGTVTGVTHFGVFVTLRDLFIEGLVHVTNLGRDYYHLEHAGLRLTGERSGKSFGLGDSVVVRVGRVDVDEAKVDLSLVGDD